MINVGGGYYFRRHWKVMEYETKWYKYSPGVIDYKHNLASEDRFPLKDNSVYLFYLSHTIEHIPQIYCQHLFNELYRCLKPGGAVRSTNPDFDLGYEAFKSKNIEWYASSWDIDSQLFLRQYDLKHNKIASAMLVNYDLLETVAEEGKMP